MKAASHPTSTRPLYSSPHLEDAGGRNKAIFLGVSMYHSNQDSDIKFQAATSVPNLLLTILTTPQARDRIMAVWKR